MPRPRLREIKKNVTSIYIQETVNLYVDTEYKHPACLSILGYLTLHTSFSLEI